MVGCGAMGGFVPRTTLFLIGGSVCQDRWLFQNDGFDGSDRLWMLRYLEVWAFLFSSINHLSTHFRIIRRRKDHGGLCLLLSEVVVCAGGRVGVPLDSVLVVFAWFDGRHPLGSLCVCFSFAGSSSAFGCWWS